MSSVYYDDREMQSYMTRLRRDDRATAIRVRFYGERAKSGEQQLYLERKTHRENWTGEKSCKVSSWTSKSSQDYFNFPSARVTLLHLLPRFNCPALT